jgi:hypothetical protein
MNDDKWPINNIRKIVTQIQDNSYEIMVLINYFNETKSFLNKKR